MCSSGRFVAEKIIPVGINNQGIPTIDENFASGQLVRRLMQADFPTTLLQIQRLGEIVSTADTAQPR